MARPTKNNAEYFSHDAGMRNDPKIRALRKRFANGYAIYCMLLEVLTSTDYFTLEIDEIQLEILAGDFDTDAENLHEIIKFCVKIKLLSLENYKISSCGLNKRLQGVLDKRNIAKERFKKQKPQNEDVSVTETTQSKVKYSKVKESKDNNSNYYPSTTANAVDAEAAAVEDFSKKIETVKIEVFEEKKTTEFSEKQELERNVPVEFPEDEFIAAWEALKVSGEITLIKMQHEKDVGVLEKYFRVFYEQKLFGGEMSRYRTKQEFFKNFYYWIPKYKISLKNNQPTNGNTNLAPRQSRNSSGNAEQRSAERSQLNRIANTVLLGTQANQ